MIHRVAIERFKAISSVSLELDKINVLVGPNNAGKSSILQALQFATSVAQTASLYSQGTKFDRNNLWATSVYPNQLIYSPVKDPYALAQGGTLREDENRGIRISFSDDTDESVIATFRKGKNKNIAARFEGTNLGQKLSSLETPFCMYVPGLAGIPFEEEIRTVGVVRRTAAKGDSNTVFRNVINLLYEDPVRWGLFLENLKVIFPEIEFDIKSNPNIDGSIDVKFRLKEIDPFFPVDLAGTGVLQATQIAAYVNYFQPALLLLDEPDSHLHPDNQRALASLLIAISDRTETTIIISTHSRHLMSALREDAKFFLVKNGGVSDSNFDHYIGLLELGAIDEYDHIRDGDIKYIVLTEDSSETSKKYLRGVLESSGYTRNEFQIYSYDSVTKVESAKMFASFLLDLNPNLKVIIYRDRDGLYDDEVENLKRLIEFDTRVKCIISYFNDLEMYYCNMAHIVSICLLKGFILTEQDANQIIADAISEAEDVSKEKFFAHRVEITQKAQTATGPAMNAAVTAFDSDKLKFSYGKKVTGLIKSKLQQKFGENIDIFKPSDNLIDDQFATIHTDE